MSERAAFTDQSDFTGYSKSGRCASRLRRFVSALTALVLIITQTLYTMAHAQSVTAADFEPPTIELEETRTGIAGEAQVFTAFVTDNQALKDVKLYFRYSGQQAFRNKPMQPIAGSGYYSATIPTATDEVRDLQYYIQARDQSGNRVVRGYAFDPLIRTLSRNTLSNNTQSGAQNNSSGDIGVSAGNGSDTDTNGGVKWWHIALGVLAVGALAGAAGGSGGDDTGGNVGTVPVTLTVNPPTN